MEFDTKIKGYTREELTDKIDSLLEEINTIKTINASLNNDGSYWRRKYSDFVDDAQSTSDAWSCSNCGFDVSWYKHLTVCTTWKYCPNCGAQMSHNVYNNKCACSLDEICTNDESPYCADYCPVNDFPNICKFYKNS